MTTLQELLAGLSPSVQKVTGALMAPQVQQPARGLLSQPYIGNPNIQRQAATSRENQFLSGIMATPWFKEYVQQYGETPDLNTPDYDYRKAWAAGIRPERDPYDNNRYHWRSSLDNGQMLKAADHPTAWKEHFMRETGKNPDALGITREQWESRK